MSAKSNFTVMSCIYKMSRCPNLTLLDSSVDFSKRETQSTIPLENTNLFQRAFPVKKGLACFASEWILLLLIIWMFWFISLEQTDEKLQSPNDKSKDSYKPDGHNSKMGESIPRFADLMVGYALKPCKLAT